MRPGRRESRRHKDSYRPGNVEEVHERGVGSSLFFSLSHSHFTHPSSRTSSFSHPRARTRRVGVPFRDLRRFNRAINLTPCCNNTSRQERRGGGEIKTARERGLQVQEKKRESAGERGEDQKGALGGPLSIYRAGYRRVSRSVEKAAQFNRGVKGE